MEYIISIKEDVKEGSDENHEFEWSVFSFYREGNPNIKGMINKRTSSANKNIEKRDGEQASVRGIDAHDRLIGQEIVNKFNYSDVPWKDEKGLMEVYIPAGNVRTRGQKEFEVNNFFGNFSIIQAQGDSFYLGIMNSSHRASITDVHHLGSACVVEITDNCLIIFHEHVFHFGDRNEFKNYNFQDKIRLFAFLSEVRYTFPVQLESFRTEPHYWCQDCDACKKIRSMLEKERWDCPEYHRWVFPYTNHEIDNMVDGSHVMGNRDTLGWAVIKGHTLPEDQMVDYAKIMRDIQGIFKSWLCIQGLKSKGVEQKDKHLQFPNLVNRKLNEKHFLAELKGPGSGKGGCHMMYGTEESLKDKLKEDYPIIYNCFEENLEICSKYIRMNTTIRAFYVFNGHNIIVNRGAIREQSAHTDYRKFPKPKKQN